MTSLTLARRSLGAVLLLAVAAGARSQEPSKTAPAATIKPAPPPQQKSQDELKELRAHKLAKDVFKNATWRTDFDQAKAEAKKDGKLLLVYFTRSYAY